MKITREEAKEADVLVKKKIKREGAKKRRGFQGRDLNWISKAASKQEEEEEEE